MADITQHFNDVQQIIEILKAISNTVDQQTDVTRTGFNSADELVADLTRNINDLQLGKLEAVERIYYKFLPTGRYQELSIDNGWGNEFIKLSNQFDWYYDRIKSLKLNI